MSLALVLAVTLENHLKEIPHTAENPEEMKTSSEISLVANPRDLNLKRAFARQPFFFSNALGTITRYNENAKHGHSTSLGSEGETRICEHINQAKQ